MFFSSYNISVPNDSCCILSSVCWSGFGMLLLVLGKTQQKQTRGPPTHTRYQTCPFHLLFLKEQITRICYMLSECRTQTYSRKEPRLTLFRWKNIITFFSFRLNYCSTLAPTALGYTSVTPRAYYYYYYKCQDLGDARSIDVRPTVLASLVSLLRLLAASSKFPNGARHSFAAAYIVTYFPKFKEVMQHTTHLFWGNI